MHEAAFRVYSATNLLLGPQDTPAYIVGVIGHLDLREPEESNLIKTEVQRVFQFLKPAVGDAEANSETTDKNWRKAFEGLVAQLPETENISNGTDAKAAYRSAMENWPRLKATPLLVLSSLAPGAATLVAEEALARGDRVMAILPLPPQLYAKSRTFVWKNAPAAENAARQATLQPPAESDWL